MANLWGTDNKEELDNLPDTEGKGIEDPQVCRDTKVIKKLKSSKLVNILGLLARPNDDCSNIMLVLRGKLEDWTINIKNRCLPRRLVWQSYLLQLWAGMKHGLGLSLATLKQLFQDLGLADFYLIIT